MAEMPKTMRREPKESASEEKRVSPERKAAAPVTRVKSSGRINRRLESLAELFQQPNQGRSVRWVYDPSHKPDLSNVLNRTVDGFEMVYVKDLGGEAVKSLPGLKQEDPVRVGDTVMMSIAEEMAKEMRDDLDRAAADEMTRVEQEHQQAIEEITATKGGKTYSPRPLGTSLTEEVEREVEGPASHSEVQD